MALALTVLGCTGCFRKRDESKGTEATSDSSSLIPTPGVTLPGEDGTTLPQTGESTTDTAGGSQTSGQQTTTQIQQSTTSAATTTKKQETTKAPETTTKKPETTTKAPETTTKKPETTTKAPETTTERPTEAPTTPSTTTVTPVPDMTSITLPMPDVEDGKVTEGDGNGGVHGTATGDGNGSTVTTPVPGTGTTVPEVSAGEWLHFEDFRDKHLGAAAYLGRSASQMPVEELITHFGLPLEATDITVIDRGDTEDGDADAWYLILPRYRDTVVRIREAEQTSRRRTRSGEPIAEGMHPMLIRLDPEEDKGSLYVELIRGEETVSFAIGLDKESGKPAFHERMLDITPEQMTR